MSDLPNWLKDLEGLIASKDIPLLRVWIKSFATMAGDGDVIKISEFILQRGIEIHEKSQVDNRFDNPEV